MPDPVLFEVRDAIALLTLNRPEKLNALDYATIDRLLLLLDQIEDDQTIRAVILTGAGERAFSAGGDIEQFSSSIAQGVDVVMKAFVRRGQAMTTRLETFPKPIIAAVNGIAFGGGCEITEAVALAIASDRAMFAKPEIKLGIPPTFGGTQRLPRVAGRKRALELLLTGDSFSPRTALEMGLVNKVVPHGELMKEAFAMAQSIICHSAGTARAILSAVNRGLNVSLHDGLQIEGEQFARVAASNNTLEALTAWMERRAPVYEGR
ncbi:MAG: crotonase/enoyl-CoA hydratase family protein [Cohaesibacteraceae bacterium]|nr:crotonase/enoyl-CoA hydratase family protein [Cohaesibacteraceae bacterium]MBL4875882.1 crotonase/enoyl-CoA hydratase family protein [Cohaesibacteraceae bacterium]